MKDLLGLGVIILGAVLGLYVGLYICLIGGILQIAANLQPINTTGIAWGIIKLIFSGSGWFIFIIGLLLGKILMK
jgi:hypothetical protein